MLFTEVVDLKNTEELLNEIKESENILDYFSRNREDMQLNSFPEYLDDWLMKKKLTKAEVVRLSNLNRAYVYQIFLGKKYPSRDKVIALAFGLQLNANEAQTLLKQAGYRELYPRDPRDSLIFYAINQGKNIIETCELLYDHNIEVLE